MLQKLRQLIQNYCGCICVLAVLTIIHVSYLQYELEQNNRDLLYWIKLLELLCGKYKYLKLIFSVAVIGITVIFMKIIVRRPPHTFSWYDELNEQEVKQYYANFLFIRLVTEIDTIDTKYLRHSHIISEESQITAHQEMFRAVENFRKGARKLLCPNETELTLPIEEVFGIMDDEDRALRRSRFYNVAIAIDNELIRSLAIP